MCTAYEKYDILNSDEDDFGTVFDFNNFSSGIDHIFHYTIHK